MSGSEDILLGGLHNRPVLSVARFEFHQSLEQSLRVRMVHLDGHQAIRHLDLLLDIDALDAI